MDTSSPEVELSRETQIYMKKLAASREVLNLFGLNSPPLAA